VIGIAVVVLLLFAIRGCLDARKERSYEKYLSDLDSLVANSSQLSTQFFDQFQDPGDADELEFQARLGAARGTSEDLLNRVQGLDTPGELSEAQADLELAFELRRDGVTSVVEQTEIALGEKGATDATAQIATDMRQFLASDVLYARAKAEIEDTLEEEGLGGDVPTSNFLPEPIELWLNRLEIDRLLSQVAGETGAAGDSTRGTEISSVVVRPGNIALTTGSLNSVPQVPNEVEVAVLNGGTGDEPDVQVAVEILGSTEPIESETSIDRINPGSEASAVVPIEGEIPEGDELTMIVTVFPVPGETIIDNNEFTYQVVFGG